MKLRKRLAALAVTGSMLLTSALGDVSAFAAVESSQPDCDYSYSTEMRGLNAFQIVSDMGAGWNLGNALESEYNETYWGNPATTRAMIDKIAEMGFTTLRVPVRWDDHYSSGYNIQTSYMDRVEEVVNYGLDNDMYVILNIHHNDIQEKVSTDSTVQAETKAEMESVWTQIATRFRNYGDKLIFETINEPRDGDDWTGTAALYDCVNLYNETARSAIRSTGGNNASRLIMMPTYCASGDMSKIWGWEKNSSDDMIAVSIHAYLPMEFAFDYNDTTKWENSHYVDLKSFFNRINNRFISNGIPVVIGEFGAINKNNTDQREIYADIYGSLARGFAQQDIPCVWWDNNAFNVGKENFGLFNRSSLSFTYPDIAKNLVAAYSGDPDCEASVEGEMSYFSGSASCDAWAQAKYWSGGIVQDMVSGDKIECTYSSDDAPELILQSFTNSSKGWVKINPDSVSNGKAYWSYSTIFNAYKDNFNDLDAVYVGATFSSITVSSVKVIKTVAGHTHSYNGTTETTLEATATTDGRKSTQCSVSGCNAVKITVIPAGAEEEIAAPTLPASPFYCLNDIITVKWNAVEGATSYRVYRATSETGTKTLLKTTGILRYTDQPKSGTYYYYIAAYNSKTGQLSDYSPAIKVSLITKPVIYTCTYEDGGVYMTWNTVNTATSYRVFRTDADTGVKTQIKTVGFNHCNDTNIAAGKTYIYTVQAFNNNLKILSASAAAKTVTIPSGTKPVITSAEKLSNGVALSWDGVADSTSYRIYRADSATGAKTLLKSTGILRFTDTTAVSGKTYYYFVAAYNSKTGVRSDYSAAKSITA